MYEIDGKPAFRINLYDHAVARKWKKLIQSIYVGDGEDIDHKRTFFFLRTEKEIRQILLQSIVQINKFLKTEFIQIPNKINWKKQYFYNDLHIKFEKLSGTYDNPSKLIKIAPLDIKENIRDINFCVHALEQRSEQDNKNVFNIQWTKKRAQTPRFKFSDDEYSLIKFHMEKNEVYLAYNELGKSFIDLWKDNLPINYSATKNNHFIGPDIFISFKDKENIFDKKFTEWCRVHNIDPFDKKHGIGILPIGKISDYMPQHLTKDSKLDIIKGI